MLISINVSQKLTFFNIYAPFVCRADSTSWSELSQLAKGMAGLPCDIFQRIGDFMKSLFLLFSVFLRCLMVY